MPDSEQASAQHDPAASRGGEQLPYHTPLLRSHGSLRDLTAQMSGVLTMLSDVGLKDNIVPVSWA